ncbi:MAG TPA: two-component system response regulator CreB [Accumulibacter sp.]|uniref:two-component system response regulator CreB n=1 Tax=Accumulibacter sp. TaxID=2053492 RepID=UPI002C7D8242|nr:two-component system response regulator CreB [Accumulibacter sp.]HMW65049.1 two-component system response regulator CreB [Accumulibacter sp.]HMX69906.1 two-component system response regulator CreB [Accumulibacter sp.]HNC28318.1 two-component system response regulator CreB [Accumulibacter sp.]
MSPPDAPPRILIVDDEPAISDALVYALQREGLASDCVGLGRDALATLRANGHALVILDVGLPDLSGFDVCRELRRASDVPVLFLTARADEIDRIVGLELGADDYVAKPFSPREVAARVRAILRRARVVVAAAPTATPTPTPTPTPAVRPVFAVDADGARIAYRGVWLELTRYEYRLLATLIDAAGRILSRPQLMDRVWRDAEESMERTVDAHVKTLRAKLRAVDDSDPIETHRGLGYSLRRDLA